MSLYGSCRRIALLNVPCGIIYLLNVILCIIVQIFPYLILVLSRSSMYTHQVAFVYFFFYLRCVYKEAISLFALTEVFVCCYRENAELAVLKVCICFEI